MIQHLPPPFIGAAMTPSAILRRCYPHGRVRGVGILRSIGNCRYMNSDSFRGCGSAYKSISPSGTRPRPVLRGGGRDEIMDAEAELVGSSHGWLAVFNKRSNDLFLSNPLLSHRRINLPPYHTLPYPDFIFDLDGRGSVSKVILSSSPDDEECRAMMSFGPANSLAFCLPGRSSEWIPIGARFFPNDHHFPFDRIARVHEDLVYCSRRKVFTSITAAHLDLRNGGFEDYNFIYSERWDWDIEDPNSPLVRSDELYTGYENGKTNSWCWLVENRRVLAGECIQIPHLVYAEESDQLFLALRFVRLMEEEDGESPLGFVPTCEVRGLSGFFPGKTVGFVVMEMVKEDEYDYLNVVDDLNGMSMFVGINHSFAISISGGDENFKPNSIYFTDAKRIQRVCGVSDYGVFDYATKTVSPVSYAYDDGDGDAPNQSFKASPFWFT